MTNEQMCEFIRQGDSDELIPLLWDKTKNLFYMLAEKHYNRYKDRAKACGVELADCRQACYLAYVAALRNYNKEPREEKFSTFAAFQVKNEINSLLGLRTRRTMKEPLNNCTSLDAPIGEDFDTTLADTIPDENAGAAFVAVEDEIIHSQLQAALNVCMKTLTADEQEVIHRRYYKNEYLQPIADDLGVSRERVRQTEASGLRKLRRPANKKLILTAVEETEFIAASTSYNASGLQRFKNTFTSSVELAYERIEIMRAGRIAE